MPEKQEHMIGIDVSEHPINQFVAYVRENAGDDAADALFELYLVNHKSVQKAALDFAEGRRYNINIDRFLHWASTPQGHAFWQYADRKVDVFTIRS